MIEAINLVKSFEQTRALDGLTLTVPNSAVYGLVGPNGAGKSTLIRHLTGIYRQDEGELLVNGEPVYENPAVKKTIAGIPDEIPFWSQATVDDMMRFYASVYPGFDRPYYENLGKALELDGKRMMRKLSKGQQKLAAFGFALAQRPEILVLDEPLDGLDPVNRRTVWGLILGDVAERGTSVLVSSHNLRELEDVCDHVGIMNRVLTQSQGAGGCLRPCRNHEPRKDAAGTQPQRAAGKHGEDPAVTAGRQRAARRSQAAA